MLLSSWLTTVLSRIHTDQPADRKRRRSRGKLWQTSDIAMLNERLEERTLLAAVITVDDTSTYVEDAVPIVVAPNLTLTDPGGPNLTGATVSLTTNFNAAQDLLGFTNQNGITGSYDAATGLLSLSGSASAATYQAALRSVTYSNNSQNPSTTARSVQFSIGSTLANRERSLLRVCN
jgi:hypothetical protein